MENKMVCISNGNRKMGQIPSVSLPPIVTCKNCATCAKKCYAAKLARIYPTVRDSYNRNLEILNEDRDAWLAINAPDGRDENGTKVESFNQMTYDEWRQWRKEQEYA
jgi:hypothetical protein